MDATQQQHIRQEIRRVGQDMFERYGRCPGEGAIAIGLYAAAGLSNKGIAELMCIRERVVKRQLIYLAEQLGIASGASDSIRIALVDILGRYLPVPTTEYNLGDVLTRAELEIARYISQGMTNKEIAAKRATAVSTIKHQIYTMTKKLGTYNIANRVGIALAYRQEMKSLPSVHNTP